MQIFGFLMRRLICMQVHFRSFETPHGKTNNVVKSLLSNDSVYARIGTVDSGENRIGKSFKMAALYQKRVDTFPKLG